MESKTSQAISKAIVQVLRPLVRIMLRNGMSYGVFQELSRGVFADVALREFALDGRRSSVSRAALVTGLSRKEIARLMDIPSPGDDLPAERFHRASAVVSGWVRDPRFHDEHGQPLVLSWEAEGGVSFGFLVKEYSRDVPPRAVLDELLRVGTVERAADNHIRLLQRAYVPIGDDISALHILGEDARLLIATIDHNLTLGDGERHFQRKVAYNNLPAEALPALRELTQQQGQQLLEAADHYLASHDRDTNPNSGGTGRKHAGIGIYYFEEDAVPHLELEPGKSS